MKWFNPLIYLFRKHLRLTHEYIADQYVSDQIEDRIGYANILLTHSQEATQHPLSHTFYSSIRDRLKMLGHQGSSKWSLAKLTLLIPVVISLVALFAFDLSDEFDSYSQGVDEISEGYESLEGQSVIVVPIGDQDLSLSPSRIQCTNFYTAGVSICGRQPPSASASSDLPALSTSCCIHLPQIASPLLRRKCQSSRPCCPHPPRLQSPRSSFPSRPLTSQYHMFPVLKVRLHLWYLASPLKN